MVGSLLRTEFLQLLFRRRVSASLVGVVLLGIALPVLLLGDMSPLTGDTMVSAQASYVDSLRDGTCDTCSPTDFLYGYRSFGALISDDLGPASLLTALIVFMVVVVYVAADFSSGALSTQLTFTPARRSVLAARCIGAGLLGATLMGLGTVTSLGVSVVWYMAMHGVGSIGVAPGAAAFICAAVLYGAFIGIIGALLVFLTNGPVWAALLAGGVLAVNLIVSSEVSLSKAVVLRSLMPVYQGSVLLTGEALEYSYEALGTGRLEAVVYHLLVIMLLAVVTVPVFDRRDIRA